ncbi:MAG TPA: hypothetical protein VJK54_05540, partial [Chthoniobacterales bacterium]|nr:hypothetical protein [Chthoniobacterales bacterium]
NATKKADQAFQALKMARDAAYAGIVESSSQQQSQQKIASLQTPEGKEAQVKEAAEQADAIAFAKTRELQAVEQVAIAKKASEAARDEDDWSEQSAWGRVAQLTEQAVKQWQKASDALTQGKKERATLLRKAAEQSEVFAEELKEVVQAYASGDLAKAESLEKTACIGMYLSKVSIYSLNSEEATASNQPELAVMWCKTAKQYEELAEHARQVASTRSSKNYTDYKQVYNSRMRNAEYLEKAAIAQEKVIKAMTANQPKLVALWLKTSNLYEESSEYYRQKLAAIAAGNTADSERLNRVAGSAEHYAQRLEKTSIALERGIQAETINKGEEAALWMKSAKYYEEAAEYYGKSREAELNENTDDKERFWEMYRSADRGAQLLEQAAIAQEKITQAKIEGRRKEATQWIEVAKQYEGVAALILREGPSINIDPKDLKQSVSCMESRANKLKKALIAQEKATQATTENQPEIADLWLKIVKQYEESAEYDRQLANTYLNGNTNNRDCLSRAMNTMEDSVKCLEQAAIARGKTINTRVVNQRALSGLWLEIAEQYEVTADYHYQEAKLARRDKNAQYDAEYMSYWNCKNNLRDSFDALKKATKATIANRGEIAAPWLEIAKCYKVSVEYYAQAADAALRDPNNHDRFYKAGYLLVDSANQLKEAAIIHEKATQATVANEKEIVGLCLQAAKEYKKSAEYYRQASNAKLNRNETDFYRFKQAGESAKKSAEALRTQVYELEKN